MTQSQERGAYYLLVLSPEVNKEIEAWDYRPFGESSIREIVNDIEAVAQEAVEGTGHSRFIATISPFPYFFFGFAFDDLDGEVRNLLVSDTRFALVDCDTLENDNSRVMAQEAVSDALSVVGLFCSGDQNSTKTAYLIDKRFTESCRKRLAVRRIRVNSDMMLIALLVQSLCDTGTSFVLDRLKE